MEEKEEGGDGGGGGGGGYHRPAKRLRTEEGAAARELEDGEEEDEEEEEGEEREEEDSAGEEAVRSARAGSRSRRSGGKDGAEDSHHIPPSPVVHVRGLCDAVVEADLVEALEKFGTICYVMMMPFKRQALVEFDSVESAERCVTGGGREPVYIADQQAFFNFSTSQRITRPTNADDPTSKNKVLLLSIQNPLYPITTDVLYTVCNPVGNVLRIVIFKRNGIQAMVEFESVEDAQKAKLALNGADIYSGCCTLKIEYARPNRLNVVRNDNTSWDYTKPFLLHRERGKGRQRQAILGEHPSNGYGPHCPLLPLPANSRYRRSSEQVQDMISYPPLLPKTFPSTSSSSLLGSSSVAMVSGLHPSKMNCSRIFNLFCLYGNVEKVKFMKSVPGTALVEMGDEYAVDRAVTHLNGIKVFGKKLNVCVSKQQAVIPSQVFELADCSSSYQDFSLTRNNRFSSAHSSRNIIQPPAAVLHFYNGPPTLTQHQLLKLCSEHNVPSFIKFKVFDAKPSSKTLSGLLEFDSKTEAIEALTVLNHHQIRIPGISNPFTLKLCFSTSSHL
ncbi:Heterogeneous nuclear ribonucleoprotein L-like [Oryzias melastigma]|uniref:Heterogeneous nuclear ribonucleoprotein L-like n=1 Tax=Oryzias melastigma TaxID=30732 RepID=A0A3B3BP43_ORYME|nr:heterogeneous nuclear ribonucleoprotein L-like [Oryzias melastigma]KAF6718924.1 Heterogeneous nuclear ribonucleoprotein L-like [Oryzias melastigma]